MSSSNRKRAVLLLLSHNELAIEVSPYLPSKQRQRDILIAGHHWTEAPTWAFLGMTYTGAPMDTSVRFDAESEPTLTRCCTACYYAFQTRVTGRSLKVR